MALNPLFFQAGFKLKTVAQLQVWVAFHRTEGPEGGAHNHEKFHDHEPKDWALI